MSDKAQTVVRVQQVSVAKPSSTRLANSPAQYLVNQVSCEIKAGEILAIIGPNGAGKSTLLKAIMQEISYVGEISAPLLAQNPQQRARQVAVLPQLNTLSFPFTVAEVVALGRIPHATGLVCDQEIIDKALDLMDIKYLKHRRYPNLSGGEKQRVQLARVLTQIWRAEDAPNQTRLLLLDEPTTALDLGHQQDLMRSIKVFAKQGVAVAMVMHDINLAAQYVDKLLALLCSQTLAYGRLDEVMQKAIIEKLFTIQADIIQHPQTGKPIVVGVE